MSNPQDAHDAQSFKYDETMRVLNRQATVLSELRNRANILLAANAVVATLFGTSALGPSHPLALKILALAAFALGIGLCVAVLWTVSDKPADISKGWRLVMIGANHTRLEPQAPRCDRRQWQVTFDLNDVVDFVESAGTVRVGAVRNKFEIARKVNYRTIARRTRFFEWACVLLAVQIVFWSWLILTPSTAARTVPARPTATSYVRSLAPIVRGSLA